MRNAAAFSAVFVLAATGLAGGAWAQDVDLMQFADPNMDGKVTPEEYASFSAQGWDFFAQGADKVKVADLDPAAKGAFSGIAPDADGYVTKAAYLAGIPDRFKAADKNGDGTLNAAELNATMKPPG